MLPTIRIEDGVEDLLSKSMRGLGMTATSLAAKVGLREGVVSGALEGRVDPQTLDKLAQALSLDNSSLRELCKPCEGPEIELPCGLIMLNTAHPVPGYAEMTVNSYLLFSAINTTNAIAFDTGSDPAIHDKILSEQNRKLRQLFLTHTHRDHVAAYDALFHSRLEVFACKREPFEGATLLGAGEHFELAEFSIKALETRGHSPGGTSYLIEGLDRLVVIVGDALFCRSIGTIPAGLYEQALRQIEATILTLPGETILCPGHGPPSTVSFEKAHNPFFAGRFSSD